MKEGSGKYLDVLSTEYLIEPNVLSGLAPDFLSWLDLVARPPGLLQKIFDALSGDLGSPQMVLKHLNALSLDSANPKRFVVNRGALDISAASVLKPLKIAFANWESKGGNLVRRLGAICHKAFQYWLADDLWRAYLTASLTTINFSQPDFSWKGRQPKYNRQIIDALPTDLRDGLKFWTNVSWAEPLLKPQMISDKPRQKTEELRQELRFLAEDREVWLKNQGLCNDLLIKLIKVLDEAFRPFLWEIIALPENEPDDRWFKIMSVASLANIFINYSSSEPIFSELRFGIKEFSGKRIDVLKAVDWQGKKIPSNLAIGPMLSMLRSRTELIEVKFGAGDGLGIRDLLAGPDLPLEKHQEQLGLYETLACLDQAYHLGQESIDFSQGPDSAYLIYVLPFADGLIVSYETNNAFNRELLFYQKLVLRWEKIKRVDLWQRTTKAVVELVTDAANGLNHHNGSKIYPEDYNRQLLFIFPSKPTQLELPFIKPITHNSLDFQSLMERHRELKRQFTDENKVIEIVRFGFKERFIMHLDRLSELIKQGLVKVGRVSLPYSIMISCVFPEHNDPGPSMCLYLDQDPEASGRKKTYLGRFYCFGCQGQGWLSGRLVIDGVDYTAAELAIGKKQSSLWSKQYDNLVIPEQHSVIMGAAQQILTGHFHKSQAWTYTQNRKIDPDLAWQYGAGYEGDDANLILSLLDMGYSLDDLIFYGFLGISSKIKASHPLILKLSKKIPLKELQRECFDDKATKVSGLPFSFLADHVTFPLKLKGDITNFYGRVLPRYNQRAGKMEDAAKKYRHTKLPTRLTNVPQGGFNMEALNASDKDIIVAEAIFDALTLIMMGDKNTMAIIGLGNNTVWSEIKAGQKETIFLALDMDEAGREATKKTINKLNREDILAVDYTSLLMFKNPDTDWSKYDDINAWWQKEGYQQFQNK